MNAAALDTGRHQAASLMAWLEGRNGGLERAGVRPLQNQTVLSSDVAGMREMFQPLTSPSGFPVSDYTAMLVGTVYACLSKLSGAVLQLPIHQYKLAPDGERERLPATPLWWLLNESPIDAWTAASWKEWIMRCVALRGDQHTQILRATSASAGGTIVGFKPLHPDMVVPRRVGNRLAYSVTDIQSGSVYGVDQDDMLHFSSFGFNGLRSLSLIQNAARASIGNALAAADYMGRNVGEGAMPKITLEYPNKLDKTQAAVLRDSFVATYLTGPGQKRMPLVLTEGGKATALNLSPIDIQLLESRRFEREDICQAFGVPPVMIGENEKTSSWGTGVEQISLGFVKFTLKPHLVRWREELNRKLFRRAGQFVDFDLDELLAGDSEAQNEAFRASLGGPGSGDGWASVNEVRRAKNMKRLEKAGDVDYDQPFRATPMKPGDVPPPKPAKEKK